jgi:hypothetical protein
VNWRGITAWSAKALLVSVNLATAARVALVGVGVGVVEVVDVDDDVSLFEHAVRPSAMATMRTRARIWMHGRNW